MSLKRKDALIEECTAPIEELGPLFTHLCPVTKPMMIISATKRVATRPAPQAQRAGMHLGRATAADTQVFLERSDARVSSAKLRLGQDSHATITRRGVGSPYLWAKDVPRIDATKNAITTYQSNFVQASINPYDDTPPVAGEKQSFVESVVIQEAIEDEGIPREALVVSALLEDSLTRPATVDPFARLSSEYIDKGVKVAVEELDVEALDHVVVRVPDELLFSEKLHETLLRATGSLEELIASGKIQSYGFALPSFTSSASTLDKLVETSLLPLSEKRSGFASLQLPIALNSAVVPLPSSLRELQTSRDIFLIAEKAFDASLSNGKPLVLRTYSAHLGEDIALLLKSAFNLAISIERKYMEKILPDNSQLNLPAAEDVAWAHILANQHSQFDNLEEWTYIRETQIYPRFEITVKQFEGHEHLKEFGFAYSMALRELLKCFTASIEILDASRAENIHSAIKENGLLVSEDEALEQIAAKVALSAGADVVLFQEQLGKSGRITTDALYTPAQLDSIARLARPFLTVE